MGLLFSKCKKICAAPLILKKKKKKGNLFFRQSRRPHSWEEKLEIWQDKCFSHSGNPPQSDWLEKDQFALIELRSSAFHISWLWWDCASLGLTEVGFFCQFLLLSFGACCCSPEVVAHSERLWRRGERRNGRIGGMWDKGGRPRGETSDGEINSRAGARPGWSKRGLGWEKRPGCGRCAQSEWQACVPQDKIGAALFADRENVGGHWQPVQNYTIWRVAERSGPFSVQPGKSCTDGLIQKWEELGNVCGWALPARKTPLCI